MSKEIFIPTLNRTITLVRWWQVQRVVRLEPGVVPLTHFGTAAAYLITVGVRERGTRLSGTLHVIQNDHVVFDADVDSLVVPAKIDPPVDLTNGACFIEIVGVDRWVDVILGAHMKEPLP